MRRVVVLGVLALAGATSAESPSDARFVAAEPLEVLAAETPLPGQVFRINIIPGQDLLNLPRGPQALAAVQRAAAQWEAVIRDPIQVNIMVSTNSLVLVPVGAPRPEFSTAPVTLLTTLRAAVSLMAADAADEPSDTAARRLTELSDPFSVILRDSFYNGMVLFNKAQMKALVGQSVDQLPGFDSMDGFLGLDPELPFDLDNRDGVSPDLEDLETRAVHEIGHILGFDSVLALLQDVTVPRSIPLQPLDLFRFEASPLDLPAASDFGVRPRTVAQGVESMFDDIDHELAFSSGRGGDGNLPNHWKADELTGVRIGVMDPTLAPGEVIAISAADKRALDVLGYEIASAEALPSVSILANGAPASATLAVPANQVISFGSQSADDDGLGFPLFRAFGSSALISQLWDFGGVQPTNGSFAVFTDSPQVRFDLPPGSPSQVFPVSVTAFDTLGDSSRAAVNVIASEPPSVAVRVEGEIVAAGPRPFAGPIAAPRLFRSGQPIQLEALAFDADGLGFPIFPGSSTRISYVWDFAGGQATNPLAVFSASPEVSFDNPSGGPRGFVVSVTVFDRLGLQTQVATPISVLPVFATRNLGPDVSFLVNGTRVAPGGGLALPASTLSQPVRLGSRVFDEDGLGFPVFAAFGNSTPVTYLWDFGGGQPSNPLEIFSANPVVTFPVEAAGGRGFSVSLTVFDATGRSTSARLNLTVCVELCPIGL